MKIYGPYTNNQGRKHIIYIDENGIKRSKSYPRYLMEQHLGRLLFDHETVDHINNDFLDDRIENLQILTREENALKEMKRQHRKAKYVVFICPICDKESKKRKYLVDHNRKQGKSGPYCSRNCAGKAKHAGVA